MRLGRWHVYCEVSAAVHVERAEKLRPDGSVCGSVWRVVELTDGVWWRGSQRATRREALRLAEDLAMSRRVADRDRAQEGER